MMKQLVLSTSVIFSLQAFAFESVTFITSQDQFTVKKSAQGYSVDGKPVQKDLLVLIGPFLNGKGADECPKNLGKPTLTARVTNNGKIETREFFVSRGLVRTGGECFFATGDGLLLLPMHRSYLIGPFKQSVILKAPLKIISNGKVMADLIKKNGEWYDSQATTQLDWDFFEKFEQWLKDYKVQFRVSKDAGKGKPWASIQSGNERFVVFRIQPKLWGIQRPGNNWLDVTGDWAFWYDFDSSVWVDRRTPQIQKIESAGLSPEDKLAAMKELDQSGWSRTLEYFYQRRLLDREEDARVRSHALSRMRGKPTWRNIQAEIEFLQMDPSDEMLKEVTQALRARNPKGPVYKPGTSNRLQVITEWSEWWQKNPNKKD